jgi:hypothetical protein
VPKNGKARLVDMSAQIAEVSQVLGYDVSRCDQVDFVLSL